MPVLDLMNNNVNAQEMLEVQKLSVTCLVDNTEIIGKLKFCFL